LCGFLMAGRYLTRSRKLVHPLLPRLGDWGKREGSEKCTWPFMTWQYEENPL
jgi:hypothetical protein